MCVCAQVVETVQATTRDPLFLKRQSLGTASSSTYLVLKCPSAHAFPLCFDSQHRRMDALRYLLHRGDVDVDREYGKGWTVLSVACTTKAIPVTVMKMCVVGMCLS